jgi:DNA-binding response OmpR family regulator
MTDRGTANADGDGRPVVLVVDDDEAVVEAYGLWLREECEVREAYDGKEALAEMDEAVDVVLLDRRMPAMSGDEALERIREQGYDCRVSMVTAVDPDLDIVEMGFDDYVVKPAGREDLLAVVDRLLEVATYEERLREEFSLVQKRATLESERTTARLEASEEYQALTDRLETLRRENEATASDLSSTQFESIMHGFPGAEADPESDG